MPAESRPATDSSLPHVRAKTLSEIAAAQRAVLIRIIRLVFVILIVTFTTLAFYQAWGISKESNLNYWVPIAASALLIVIVVGIDLLTPVKRISSIMGVLLGLLVGLLATLVVLAFALWAWRAYRGGGARGFSLAAALGLAAAAYVVWPLLAGHASAEVMAPAQAARTASAVDPWQPFTPTRVAELTAANKPVFVDFTAAWCVTCQVNKRLVLNRADVREAFAKRGVELVRADWTRRDPTITQALAALGRQGVPVYVLYRPGQAPLLLPEVLAPGTVLDALATL